ncbi:hypothetical protein [Streptomyces sp. NPDC044948]|uniref:hypothetical protein n=1 Tax=Streptomyces sp. NPDC044948 TaxID=3157092 RepID=UPI0033EEE891
MTSNEILLLAAGLFTGAQLTNLMHAVWANRDACRSAAGAEAAVKRAVGDRYLNSFRQYQIDQLREARS